MTQSELNPQMSGHYVAPSDFENKLISRSRLIRADDRLADAMGLLDLETGDHILVHRADWLKYSESTRKVVIRV